ncbi:beta-2 adrenergic receptor-like [Hydractinia symbiolongicarpus]|uniref:beta-2 adrenergic receptor-like n=1 Tax=Hydractinia symbiolongicarpus TaxID=13093 RepID=UPI00254FC301|nr:beta-2 adrenergic receptor-like [Hydractinia symbiolongicarpus]
MTLTNSSDAIICGAFSHQILPYKHVEITIFSTAILTLILTIFIIAVNGCFIGLLIVKAEVRKSVNILYVMLSTSDLIYGLIVLATTSVSVTGDLNDFCRRRSFLAVLKYILCSMSLSAVLIITIEIYLAVRCPFKHRARKEKNVLPFLLLAVWVLCVTVPVLATYMKNWWRKYLLVFPFYSVVVFTMIVISQRKAHCAIRSSVKLRGGQKHSLKTAILLLTCYAVSFLPLIVSNFLLIFSVNDLFVNSYLTPWTCFIGTFNPLFNGLIYSLRLKTVKVYFQRALGTSSSQA